MKNKFKILIATLTVGVAVTLAGCTSPFSCTSFGCGGNTTARTLTRSNWFTGTSYLGIQPSFIDRDDEQMNAEHNFSKEIVTYDVEFAGDGSNDRYSVDYRNGSFTTEFYAKSYNWASADIPEGYAPKNIGSEIVYCYKTELKIEVMYKMRSGEESEWFENHVVTESLFRAAGKSLQPVYSKQKIMSTSPANLQPANLQQAYKSVDVTYENYYNYYCSAVSSKTTNADGTTASKSFRLSKIKKTLFDNSSLYVAARSLLQPSATPSETVALFSAAAGGVDTYTIAGANSDLDSEKRKEYTEALKAKGLYRAKVDEQGKEVADDEGVEATAVSVSYAGGSLHGTSQTVWYASVTDSTNNVSRATMLQMSVPISFSLGTLNYTLKEVNSTLWNE